MWSSLIPLILGSALEPIEIGITIMLLGTPSHLRAAGAWIAGHGSTRLLQGLVFGTILHWGARGADSNRSHHWIVSTVLLVVALLFLVTAARELFSDDDPNAPPPKWMTMLMSATPAKAFFIGAGVITVSVKAWVFTLAAISVIGRAGFGAGRQRRLLCRIRAARHERESAHRRHGRVCSVNGRARCWTGLCAGCRKTTDPS